MMTPMVGYWFLGSALIFIGILGVLFRRNLLIVLMSIEWILNGVNVIFATFNQFFVFFIMIVAAVEVSLGLVLAVIAYKKFGSLDIRQFRDLKG